MKKLLFMLMMFGFVLFACGIKEEEDVEIKQNVGQEEVVEPQLSEEESQMAYDKATELAETAKKEVEFGNKDKALGLFNKSLKSTKIPWVFADRGKLKVDMNDIEGGIADLTTAINNEKRAIYYMWRADAYRQAGKDELADADMREAEKLPKD